LLGAPFLFRWMGGRDEMLSDALAYANVALGGAVVICVSNLLGNAVRGTGNMSFPAAVLIGCVVVHIGGRYAGAHPTVGRLQDHHHPGKRQRGAGERIGSNPPEKESIERDHPCECEQVENVRSRKVQKCGKDRTLQQQLCPRRGEIITLRSLINAPPPKGAELALRAARGGQVGRFNPMGASLSETGQRWLGRIILQGIISGAGHRFSYKLAIWTSFSACRTRPAATSGRSCLQELRAYRGRLF